MTRKYLEEHAVVFELTEVDLLKGDLRIDAVAEVRRLSGGTSFPVLRVGEEIIVGFNRGRIAAFLAVGSSIGPTPATSASER